MCTSSMPLKELLVATNDTKSSFYVPKGDFIYKHLKGYTNDVQEYKGILLPFLCRNPEVVKDMEVREDDTFVITYPKSGTHWVKELCWLIQNNQDFKTSTTVDHAIRTPFIDICFSNNFLKQLTSPRVFMTHFPLDILPENLNKRAKIVYVVRNPKDVLVSFFHFLYMRDENGFNGTLEELFSYFVKGECFYGPWWKHVDQFTQLEYVHIIHYEDLLEDTLNETRRLAKYLGKDDLSDEMLNTLIDYCSFDNLKKNPSFELKIPNNLKPGECKDVEMIELKLFRKGEIGDWKNYLDENMSREIDQVVADNLQYKKPFKFEPTKYLF